LGKAYRVYPINDFSANQTSTKQIKGREKTVLTLPIKNQAAAPPLTSLIFKEHYRLAIK